MKNYKIVIFFILTNFLWTENIEFILSNDLLTEDIFKNDKDFDGVDDAFDLCPNSEISDIVDRFGCPENRFNLFLTLGKSQITDYFGLDLAYKNFDIQYFRLNGKDDFAGLYDYYFYDLQINLNLDYLDEVATLTSSAIYFPIDDLSFFISYNDKETSFGENIYFQNQVISIFLQNKILNLNYVVFLENISFSILVAKDYYDFTVTYRFF